MKALLYLSIVFMIFGVGCANRGHLYLDLDHCPPWQGEDPSLNARVVVSPEIEVDIYDPEWYLRKRWTSKGDSKYHVFDFSAFFFQDFSTHEVINLDSGIHRTVLAWKGKDGKPLDSMAFAYQDRMEHTYLNGMRYFILSIAGFENDKNSSRKVNEKMGGHIDCGEEEMCPPENDSAKKAWFLQYTWGEACPRIVEFHFVGRKGLLDVDSRSVSFAKSCLSVTVDTLSLEFASGRNGNGEGKLLSDLGIWPWDVSSLVGTFQWKIERDPCAGTSNKWLVVCNGSQRDSLRFQGTDIGSRGFEIVGLPGLSIRQRIDSIRQYDVASEEKEGTQAKRAWLLEHLWNGRQSRKMAIRIDGEGFLLDLNDGHLMRKDEE